MAAGRLRRLWFFVSAMPTAASVGFLLAVSILTFAIWQPVGPGSGLRWWAPAAIVVFGFIDWALLASLPRLGLSFGPVGLPLFMVTLVRLVVIWIAVRGLDWTYSAWGWPPSEHLTLVSALALWLLNLGIVACEIKGLYVEPFQVRVTHLPLTVHGKPCVDQVRIAQLSDLHMERVTKREQSVLDLLEDLRPDVIVLTGDYLNGSYLEEPRARQEARWFLSRLKARHGVYAVTAKRGDTVEAVADMFGGLDIEVLRDEVRVISPRGFDIALVGVSYLEVPRDGRALEDLMREVPPEAYSVLLYHTSELAGTAAKAGLDLYLTGHTHGGQMRLPLFGAVFTNLRSWKKYEQGLYNVGDMRLYVNRGLGMEGRGGPRARFLCRPEILLAELHPRSP